MGWGGPAPFVCAEVFMIGSGGWLVGNKGRATGEPSLRSVKAGGGGASLPSPLWIHSHSSDHGHQAVLLL